MECPLCKDTKVQQREDATPFFMCHKCGSVFRDPRFFLNPQKEKERYLLHENDVNDPKYQQFVAPIVGAVIRNFSSSSVGLDFGAGTGPVISKLLEDQGFTMKLWDPFFHTNISVLSETYDFIVCCEVIEHFHDPKREFERMRGLLNPGGMLFCMTEMLPEAEEFCTWHYKNDPTHVIFYSQKNLDWIAKNLEFSTVETHGRLIQFYRD